MFSRQRSQSRYSAPLRSIDKCLDLPYQDRYDPITGYSYLLDMLPPRQAFVLKAECGYYGREYTQVEIGQMIGVSREMVRRYKKQAIAGMRQLIAEHEM